ncbi:MAG: DUF881 domain-containing protein [Bacillota bacterium]|nr:DUF881 domain-containing protein [Bacillota bacterium]
MEGVKKKKISGVVVIGVLALIIGVVLAIQIDTTQGDEVGGLIPVGQVQSMEAELKAVKKEREDIYQELLVLEERMAEIEAEKISDDAFLQSLSSELERYRMYSGLLDVKGPGIIITVDDPVPTEENPGDGYSVIMLRYDLLLSLVNKLKEAGAEAISINGHRITNTTEISLAGDNVNINGQATAPPYTIAAIGDADTMESAITIRHGIVEVMRTTYFLQVDIVKQEELTITRYTGVINFRYAVPVAEEGGTEGSTTAP